MRRKVSTIMEDGLFRRAKLEAARQGRPLSALLEEALTRYLDESVPRRSPQYRSVAETWGAMAAPPDVVRAIMEDEDEYFES
jgi:hypothetical protein